MKLSSRMNRPRGADVPSITCDILAANPQILHLVRRKTWWRLLNLKLLKL